MTNCLVNELIANYQFFEKIRIWSDLHFQLILLQKNQLSISINRFIFNKKLYIWRCNHYKIKAMEWDKLCVWYCYSQQRRQKVRKSGGSRVPNLLEDHLMEKIEILPKNGGSLEVSWGWGEGQLFLGPSLSSNFEDCPFQLTFGTYKRGLQNQS